MKKIIVFVFVILIFSLLQTSLFAQCPMCSMAAESNLKAGGSAGKGLNIGILYLYVLPYLVTGTITFLWFKNRQKSTTI